MKRARIIAILLGAAALGHSQSAGLLPVPRAYFTDNNGLPLAGGLVYSYISGTSTPLATYQDANGSSANTNPVVLDSTGHANIWLLLTGTYRIIVKTSGGLTLSTTDGVTAGSGGGGGGGGGNWTQSGLSLFPSTTGSKICSSGTACLAPLDVQGASSGTNFIVRLDDTTSATGIGMFGNGTALGYYTADSTGLRLRAADGSAQVTVSAGNVSVLDSRTSGATNFNVIEGAAQSTINPIQVQNAALSNLAYMDPAGNWFGPGFRASGTATNVIQAPFGGVTGEWLIATDSLFLIAEPQPPLSAAGQARIYLDNGSFTVNASINGGAYAPFGSGGGGGGGSFSLITTGTNSTATMTVGTGATLTTSGSGIVNANQVNGTTVPVNSAADQVLLTTAAATGSWASIPLCLDSGGNHLNYNTSTHAWSCGNTGGSVGSVAFSAITGTVGAPNTSASMVIGTGASLTTTGSGTISANLFNGGAAPTSGSLWVTDGGGQPRAGVFADVVGLFSGGAGCSGTNALAANGTCVAGGAGTPAGPTGAVQYAGAGPAFAGSGNFSWNNSTNTVLVTGQVTVANVGTAITFNNFNNSFQVANNGAVSASGVIASTGSGGGFNQTGNNAYNSIQTIGGVVANGNFLAQGNSGLFPGTGNLAGTYLGFSPNYPSAGAQGGWVVTHDGTGSGASLTVGVEGSSGGPANYTLYQTAGAGRVDTFAAAAIGLAAPIVQINGNTQFTGHLISFTGAPTTSTGGCSLFASYGSLGTGSGLASDTRGVALCSPSVFSVVLTFSSAYSQPPNCIANTNTPGTYFSAIASTTQLTLTSFGGASSGFAYMCMQ